MLAGIFRKKTEKTSDNRTDDLNWLDLPGNWRTMILVSRGAYMAKMSYDADRILAAAEQKLAVSLVVGSIAGVFTGVLTNWQIGLLAGWDITALVYLALTWRDVGNMDGAATERHAVREDPSRPAADAFILGAVVGSLIAVVVMLVHASDKQGTAMIMGICFSIVSIIVSWVTLHTLFMLHYAQQYYVGPVGGVNFVNTKKPTYRDFAYLSFTIGMTYQVSDTQLSAKKLRRTALRHALLSYVFGAFIVAAMVNLVAGLGK